MSWSVAPVFRVRDVRAAAAYYRERLGFECPEESIHDGLGDEGAIYAIARRDGIEVHLGRCRTGQVIDPGRSPNALGAYFFVPDVEKLHAELAELGPRDLTAPKLAPYGLNEITVLDLDGYHLGFGTPAPR